MQLALTILGITGKMGKRVLTLASQDPDFVVVAGHARSNDPLLQHLLCKTPEQALDRCHVAIDFSSREATCKLVETARAMHTPLVIGTTGHTHEDLACIQNAALQIPIVLSPNFSLGIALSLEAITNLSRQLMGRAKIEITETHHIHKKDKPSGTALAFAAAASQPVSSIHSIRENEVVGQHMIRFEWGEESIELKHTAHSRDAFALGALQAAKRLIHRPPGLYSLKDLYE